VFPSFKLWVGTVVVGLFLHLYAANVAVNKAVDAVHKEYQLHILKEKKKILEISSSNYMKTIEDLNVKNQKLQSLSTRRQSVINSLLNRQVRPEDAASATVAQVGESCTGKELFREDAEFLTREAARADKTVIERDFYYQKYEDARIMLELLKE
jgi:FtsZ-binding cell division protein ZapB